MKYRLFAAIAATFLGLVPGTVSAESASRTIVATGYVKSTRTLSGVDESWSERTFKHTAATQHRFVADPSAFPPDPCRSIAGSWNVAVFQNREMSAFDYLLNLSAQYHCALGIVRSDSPNADGSFDLVSVTLEP